MKTLVYNSGNLTKDEINVIIAKEVLVAVKEFKAYLETI